MLLSKNDVQVNEQLCYVLKQHINNIINNMEKKNGKRNAISICDFNKKGIDVLCSFKKGSIEIFP